MLVLLLYNVRLLPCTLLEKCFWFKQLTKNYFKNHLNSMVSFEAKTFREIKALLVGEGVDL